MPVRQKHAVKLPTGNIEAALDVDIDAPEPERVFTQSHGNSAPIQEQPRERKTAIVQLAVYPSWRKHFHVEAAKRGEKLAPIALKALIDRYGLPEEPDPGEL